MKSNDDLRYEEYTDEELILLYRDGHKEISDYICNKYKDMVRSKANSMFILGAEREDLIQEGMIGLFNAMRDYDAGRDAMFSTFANLCISRQIYKAIQASNRQKAMPLNNYISIYNQESEGEDTLEIAIQDSATANNPEAAVIDREAVELLEKKIDSQLSELERQVLELQLTGMGYVEIAKVLGRDEKSTDNAIQRIRSKIRKIIKESNS